MRFFSELLLLLTVGLVLLMAVLEICFCRVQRGEKTMWIKNRHLINYLKDNGLFPEVEMLNGDTYFTHSELLDALLDTYTITYDCVPNRSIIPRKRFYSFQAGCR